MGYLSVQMLGTPSVLVDGTEAVFPYRKAEALLYYLLLNRRASRAYLISLLWPDSDSAIALRNLRHAIYTLKKVLRTDIFIPKSRTLLEISPDADISCDALQFLADSDLSLYRGEFLQGFSLHQSDGFEDWLLEQRNIFQSHYRKALISAQRDALNTGDYTAAEQYGLRYLEIDPLDEEATVLLMKIYSAQQKFRKAIDLYHHLCQVLSDEFGISPLKTSSALYYQILDLWNSSTWEDPDTPPALLIGKDQPYRRLQLFFSGKLPAPGPSCFLIDGEAGVGKTCLLHAVIDHPAEPGRLVMTSCCYPSEAETPFAPWNTIMGELITAVNNGKSSLPQILLHSAAGLFPCLWSAFTPEENLLPVGNIPPEAGYSSSLDAAVLLLIAAAKLFPITLIFEDLHWMDPKSTELLSLLIHRSRTPRLLIICTARTIIPEHVKNFIRTAEQDELLERHTLHNFTLEETEHFIRSNTDIHSSEDMSRKIFQATDGNPLLLVQLLNSYREGADPSVIPTGLEQLMNYRLSSLSAEERQVLDLISAFTEWVSFDTLHAILTLKTLELIYTCHQLCQRMLLQESSQNGALYYMLAHEQIRMILNREQTPSAHRILHLRIAQQMESQLPKNEVPNYDRLIYHFSEGGDRAKVLQYRVQALYAYTGLSYVVLPTLRDEGTSAQEGKELPQEENSDLPGYISSLENELSALRPDAADNALLDQVELLLLNSKARYHIFSGNYAEGLDAAGRLLTCARKQKEYKKQFLAHAQYIYYCIQTFDLPVMEEHLSAQEALFASLPDHNALLAEYGVHLRLRGLFHLMRGEMEKARDFLSRSIRYFGRLDDTSRKIYDIHIAGAYNYIAESWRLEHDYHKAFENYELAIRHNRSLGYYHGTAVFFTNYGVARFQAGDHSQSLAYFRQAQTLYQASHEFSGYPLTLSYLALMQAEAGDLDKACANLKEAFRISDQIASPWWKGISLFNAWKIRSLSSVQAVDPAELRALLPADPAQHIRQCLACLRKIPLTDELKEMELAAARYNLPS